MDIRRIKVCKRVVEEPLEPMASITFPYMWGIRIFLTGMTSIRIAAIANVVG
jgi:hypothetical protein